jgi:hypothetical protein
MSDTKPEPPLADLFRDIAEIPGNLYAGMTAEEAERACAVLRRGYRKEDASRALRYRTELGLWFARMREAVSRGEQFDEPRPELSDTKT